MGRRVQETLSRDHTDPSDVVFLDDHVQSLLKEQLHILTKIEKHFSETDNSDEEKETWQDLARVLDRVFLALYILCFTVVTLVFMIDIMNGGAL